MFEERVNDIFQMSYNKNMVKDRFTTFGSVFSSTHQHKNYSFNEKKIITGLKVISDWDQKGQE